MSFRDPIGDRIKRNYEERAKYKLIRRMPVIIRLDGKAFHTFTRGLAKPFDSVFVTSMQRTTQALCENIQGCVFGYTQSDEITLVLQDYKTLTTDAWFDYEVQKICSISASMCTYYFNKIFAEEVDKATMYRVVDDHYTALYDAVKKVKMFDARCFNIPEAEVTNCIYWRQQDAIRNSVLCVGQSCFTTSELNGKGIEKIKKMLIEKRNLDWDAYFPTYLKRGAAIIKTEDGWKIDLDMPVLRGEGRAYVEDVLAGIREEKNNGQNDAD